MHGFEYCFQHEPTFDTQRAVAKGKGGQAVKTRKHIRLMSPAALAHYVQMVINRLEDAFPIADLNVADKLVNLLRFQLSALADIRACKPKVSDKPIIGTKQFNLKEADAPKSATG